jgi:hypothetical protein
MVWKPDYATLAQAKDYLRIAVGDVADDASIARWVTAASRAVDDHCNRQFGSEAGVAVRTYRRPPAYSPAYGVWLLDIDDVMTSAGMLINGVAFASTGAILLPDDAPSRGLPWTKLGLVQIPIPSYPSAPIAYAVSATPWGWTTVPVQATAATLLQVARWNFRRDAPAGVAGSPDQGSEVRLLAKLDPDVATSLAGLSRPRKAG